MFYKGRHRKTLPVQTCEDFIIPLCPQCAGLVEYSLSDCTVGYFCVGTDDTGYCNWSYVHGLPMSDPGWDENDYFRPGWIPPGQLSYDDDGNAWTAPGVEWSGNPR